MLRWYTHFIYPIPELSIRLDHFSRRKSSFFCVLCVVPVFFSFRSSSLRLSHLFLFLFSLLSIYILILQLPFRSSSGCWNFFLCMMNDVRSFAAIFFFYFHESLDFTVSFFTRNEGFWVEVELNSWIEKIGNIKKIFYFVSILQQPC
jgi:hypothetical protein